MTNPITEIDLTGLLYGQMSSFYFSDSECYPDIILCVEDQKLPAHRFIIGASSKYFQTLFSKALNEPNQKEFIIEAPLKPFQIILKYFYTGKISLCNIEEYLNIEILIQVIDLVEKYCLFDLKPYFENYFIRILSIDNIYQLFEIAKIYDLKELKIKSLELIDKNAETILNSESFKKFPKESLEEILKRNSFDALSQLSIFNALNEWSKSGNRNIEAVSPLIKWHRMTGEDILIIRNLLNLTTQQILDDIEEKIIKIHMEDANIQKFNENFASPIYNVRTLNGKMELLNGNSTLYDEKNGYTRHLITDGNDAGIIIDLRTIRSMNHFKMLLWDRDDRSYCYFIEISTDYSNWKCIIDYSSYSCSSWQNLYFPAESIRFIRIVGTHCSKNEYFDVVAFEAYLRANIPEIRDGFVVPKENVALLKKGATIHECENGSELINGDIEQGYTQNTSNNSYILIRLDQPYHISSITLKLHDCGKNLRYKFKIQVSLNMKDWETIVNQEEFVTSWQKYCFCSKPIIYFKFIGIQRTDNDNDNDNDNDFISYFLRHFGCPAQD